MLRPAALPGTSSILGLVSRTLRVMNLHTFLLIDSVLLDVAGVAALFEGEAELGVGLVLLAAVAFITGLARRRQAYASAA